MKKLLFFAASASILAAAATSCTEKFIEADEPQVKEVEIVPMSFTAGIDEEETKAAFNAKLDILWNPSDQISVFRKNGNGGHIGSVFTTTLTSPAKKATFTGDVEALSGENDCYYAVYPVKEENVGRNTANYYAKDDGLLEIPLARIQDVPDNSFDPQAVIYAGKSNTTDIRFYNACAFLRFSLNYGNVVYRLELSSQKKYLNGPMHITFDENGKPVGSIVSESISEYSTHREPYRGDNTTYVFRQAGSDNLTHPFEQNKFYYIAIPPGAYDDLTITLYRQDGAKATRKLENFTLGRNEVVSVKSVDNPSKLTEKFSGGSLKAPVIVPELCRIIETPTLRKLSLCWKGSCRQYSEDMADCYDDVLSYNCTVNGNTASLPFDVIGVRTEDGKDLYFQSDPFFIEESNPININLEAVPYEEYNPASTSATLTYSGKFMEFSANQHGKDIVLSWPAVSGAIRYEILVDDYPEPTTVSADAVTYTLKNRGDGKKHDIYMAAITSKTEPAVFGMITLKTISQSARNKQLAPVIYEIERLAEEDTWSLGNIYAKWDARKNYTNISKYTLKVQEYGSTQMDPSVTPECKALVYSDNSPYYFYSSDCPLGGDPERYNARNWLYEPNKPYQVTVVAEAEGFDTAEGAALIAFGSRETNKYIPTRFPFEYCWRCTSASSFPYIAPGDEFVMCSSDSYRPALPSINSNGLTMSSTALEIDSYYSLIASTVDPSMIWKLGGSKDNWTITNVSTKKMLGVQKSGTNSYYSNLDGNGATTFTITQPISSGSSVWIAPNGLDSYLLGYSDDYGLFIFRPKNAIATHTDRPCLYIKSYYLK